MSAAFVEEAAEKASWIVRREVRGPGDIEPAMRRIESRYGISYSVIWCLRYRRPSDLLVSVYARICEAYETERQRQRKLLDHEQFITNATTRFGRSVVGKAQALVREKVEPLKGE